MDSSPCKKTRGEKERNYSVVWTNTQKVTMCPSYFTDNHLRRCCVFSDSISSPCCALLKVLHTFLFWIICDLRIAAFSNFFSSYYLRLKKKTFMNGCNYSFMWATSDLHACIFFLSASAHVVLCGQRATSSAVLCLLLQYACILFSTPSASLVLCGKPVYSELHSLLHIL